VIKMATFAEDPWDLEFDWSLRGDEDVFADEQEEDEEE